MAEGQERRGATLAALNRALRTRPVRLGLGAFGLCHAALRGVLVVTEQMHWLRAPWPHAVTRLLFQVFLATSVLSMAVFGTASVGSAVYLYRRRAEDPRADTMTLLRRAVVAPAASVLSVAWCVAWLTGHAPRLLGALFVCVFVAYQIVLVGYYTARAMRQTLLAQHVRAAGWGGFFRALLGALRKHAVKTGYALRRRWWLLAHPNHLQTLSPPDRALYQSAVRGVSHNIDVLLRRGANPNLTLLYGLPILVMCAGLGRTEVVRLLLDAGADVNASGPDSGYTALHNAAGEARTEIVRLLVERGANTECRMSSAATPLMLAAHRGYADAVTVLVQAGAALDAVNRKGATALILAAFAGHVEAARVLLDAGADVSVQTTQGKTALDYARQKNHTALAALLSQAQSKP